MGGADGDEQSLSSAATGVHVHTLCPVTPFEVNTAANGGEIQT